MKFELYETLRGASDEEILEDLRRSAKAIGRETITRAEYEKIGRGDPCTVHRRFGSWTKALARAGLQPSRSKMGITEEELFDNLKSLWISLGRQPSYDEVKAPISRLSSGTYENRFGSWSKALRSFVEWVNSGAEDRPDGLEPAPTGIAPATPVNSIKRRTRREISDRQRFRVLIRDGFRCTACGASPLTLPGTEPHVNHILPWSEGGETTDENLKCRCAQCNLGKGNAFTA